MMKRTLFTGAGVAIITPMHPDGSIHFEKLGELIEFQIANGTDAIIICGTTGESAALTMEEDLACIRYAKEKVAGRVPVIAGTGSNDTAVAVQMSQKAEEIGVDGLLSVTPYYNKTSQQGLLAHYTKIADAVHIPIILYNVPSRTGVNIAPETCLALSKHPNIVAIKEASGNISQVAKIRALCGDALDVYSGNDDQIVPILSLGGKGVISVLSNVMPQEAHDIVALYLAGKVQESMQLQLRLLAMCDALFCDVNPIPVKEAMNQMGLAVGECRLPLIGTSEQNRTRIHDALYRFGLFK